MTKWIFMVGCFFSIIKLTVISKASLAEGAEASLLWF